MDNGIVAGILGHLFPEPLLESPLLEFDLEVVASFREHQGAPDIGEMTDIARTVEKLLYQLGALVGGGIFEEEAGFGNGGDSAGEINVNAAKEFGVLGAGRELNLGSLPPLGH